MNVQELWGERERNTDLYHFIMLHSKTIQDDNPLIASISGSVHCKVFTATIEETELLEAIL